MDARTKYLMSVRPEIAPATINETMNSNEHFQNTTLRPVIKLQNDLFIAAFKNYIRKHKDHFYTFDIEGRLRYIENSVQKDIKFRNSLKGMVIGHFTVAEYETYIKNSSALNKRMMNMVIERLKDQMQFLEQEVAV